MLQRITIALILVLLFGFAGDAESRCTQTCERRRPGADFLEKVTVAEAGETVAIEIVFRNRDSCACPTECFAFNTGWHPPHDGSPAIRIGRTRFLPATNSACLAPGEELRVAWTTSLSMIQDGPGFVTPVAEMRRASSTINPTRLTDFIEAEGGALCTQMTAPECKSRVYAQTPTDPAP